MRRISSAAVTTGGIAMLCWSATLSSAFSHRVPTNQIHVEKIPIRDDDGDEKTLRILIAEGITDSIDSGARVWDSGRALSQWMARNSLNLQQQQGESSSNNKPRKILELGAGTGIVGLTAASAFGAPTRVVLTDQPHMTALLDENIRRNHLQKTVRAASLEWGSDREEVVQILGDDDDDDDDDHDSSLSSSSGNAASSSMPIFDIVCGSDILYSPDNFPLLLETLCQVCTPGTTEVVLAYPRRFTEDIFLETASEWFEISSEEEIDANVFITRLRLRRR